MAASSPPVTAAAAAGSAVDLGFLVAVDAAHPLGELCSKAGGAPVRAHGGDVCACDADAAQRWLDRVQVPGHDELKCARCGEPMLFMLQVYTPEVGVCVCVCVCVCVKCGV
jgi:hypothetical protein